MAYATPANLLERFSAGELAHRGSPENALVDADLMALTIEDGDRSGYDADEIAAADAALARWESLLTAADSRINGYLSASGCYIVPLSPVPSVITGYACHIARWLGYDDQIPEHVQAYYDDTIRALRDIAANKIKLTADDGSELPAPTAGPTGSPAYDSPGRVFTHTTLANY